MNTQLLLRKIGGGGLLLAIIVSLAMWWNTWQPLPETIRIATAFPGGLYYRFAEIFQSHLEKATGRKVEILKTKGSVENRELLLQGKADLALFHAGSTSWESLNSVAPLYEEVVHFIVRKDSPIQSAEDFRGKKIAVGPEGSGMRANAREIFSHYGMDISQPPFQDSYFKTLLTDETLEGAIVTAGYLNPDLESVLKSGDYRLVPLLNAAGIVTRHPYFHETEIPAGMFQGKPAIPPQAVETISTLSLIACRENAPDKLVTSTLRALYENDLRTHIPVLFTKTRANSVSALRLHPAAVGFFDPYQGIGVLASFMSAIAAAKELLFALIAFLYLLWTWRTQKKERDRQARVHAEKERLDNYLAETARIERAQMETRDVEALRVFLDDVTRIKLKAIDELTHEDLRGDRMFSIFLMQCANLSQKIQAKILYLRECCDGDRAGSEE
ncbi:MAG: TAXI family TRAP transporter solute-binding subunit [Gammaproteobacteria bacterium]|nr:TAXI family TRAP transporter solute-binding subunit [Gammaproteobacteria bacterium]